MSPPRYARLASSALAEQMQSLPPPAPTVEQRAAAIAAIQGAISARARRRRVVQGSAGLAAAAAVVVAALGFRHGLHSGGSASAPARPPPSESTLGIVAYPAGNGASVVVSGTHSPPAPLGEPRELASGSRVVTPRSGRAALTFSTGTKIALDESTDMTVGGDGVTQSFRLDTGSIDLRVAKLEDKQRFLVDTPDSEVEVRGTQFRVSVVPTDSSSCGGAQTRVKVTEGVVVVRHEGVEVRVVAGEQWPNGCGDVLTAAAPAASRRRPTTTGARESMTAIAPDPTSSSTLTEQNDLFAKAAVAKRRGDVSDAIDAFDVFLARYPASPLAESAAVERMRLLRAVAPSKAKGAASDYLARYPNGFARSEARTMARGDP
jgi:ferric-dicitrate binding protein FerR (iron transport regulator)